MWLSFNQDTMIIPGLALHWRWNPKLKDVLGTAALRPLAELQSIDIMTIRNPQVVQLLKTKQCKKVAVHRRNFGRGAQMWQKLRIREIDAATAAAEESYLRFLHPNFPLNKGEVSRDYRRGKKNEWMVKAWELCSSFRSMMILITLLWAYKLQKLTFNDLTSGGIEFLSAELLSYLNQINFLFG